MTRNDPIFGELEYEYGWTKEMSIHFFLKKIDVILMIDDEEDGIFDEEQYIAYQSLM